jgi:hypothetical protein
VLAEWDGNPSQAIAYLEEAKALAEKMGLPGELYEADGNQAGTKRA